MSRRPKLLARTQSLIKVKGLNDNLIRIDSVLFSLAVEAKDVYAEGHIVRTSQLAVVLGKRLGVMEQEEAVAILRRTSLEGKLDSSIVEKFVEIITG